MPHVLPAHKGKGLSKPTSRIHLHSHLRNRSSISSDRCRLEFVVLIVVLVTDDRLVRWILVGRRRLGRWLLGCSARDSGAATGGGTWTPSLRLEVVGVKKEANMRQPEMERNMRVDARHAPRAQSPALGRRHEQTTSIALASFTRKPSLFTHQCQERHRYQKAQWFTDQSHGQREQRIHRISMNITRFSRL